MNANEAKQILSSHLEDFSGDVKSAIEFALKNWDILSNKNDVSNAKKFLVDLTAIPMSSSGISQDFIKTLNDNVMILRKNPSVWYCTEDLPHETWRNINEYNGIYQISNFGRVRSMSLSNSKILKDTDNGNGYRVVGFSQNKKRKMFTIHRLVAEHFLINPDNKPEVNHLYGKDNNCVWALEWATHSENGFHAWRTGLKKKVRPANAKLTDEEAEFIRQNYIPKDEKFGAVALSKRFKIDPSCVRKIAYGQIYASTSPFEKP